MKKQNIILTALVAITAFTAAPLVRADEGHKHHQTKEEPSKAKEEPSKAKEEPGKPKVKPYTLTTCIVSDDKLGEMGKPVVFNYKDQEIKLCCKACRKDFDKDPAKFLKKLEPKK
jgi:hypothetical protein